MTPLALLAPKGWVLAGWLGGTVFGLASAIQFSNTIGVGAILTAALVVVLSGVFTLRGNIRSYWRSLAEERAEKIAALEEDVRTRDAEQRVLRHDLKNELAAMRQTLEVERAKTDLTSLIETLGEQHREAMDKIVVGLGKQDEIIGLLAGNWNNGGRESAS